MKCFLLIFLMFLSFALYGQDDKLIQGFKNDFTKALNKDFSENDLNKMFRDYDDILTPSSDVTRLSQTLQGKTVLQFPLSNFSSQPLYTDNINFLLNSTNPNHRILAYLVIAASGDFTKQDILLKRITTEKEKGNLLWAGMALLYFQCDHTTPLFDFLVANEDFGDAHMLPLYIQLNKDSLRQTAYNRINSGNEKARVLAAQILSTTGSNPKTDFLLMKAVKTWDIHLKGYAIYSVKELQIGNLLQTFKPLLDSPETRSIALQALANSPTDTDQHYVISLISKTDTISDELLNCLYKSKNKENIRVWLKLLPGNQLPKKYVFFVFEQPLVKADDMLADLQTALIKIKNPDILGELVRALENRVDDTSVDLMIGFLKNSNSTVRYWTAKTLKDNPSVRARSPEVTDLIEKGLNDGN